MQRSSRPQPNKNPKRALAAATTAAALALAGPLAADGADSVAERQTVSLAPTLETATAVGFADGSFIVAPIPFSNPMIGSGLALGTAYLFNFDDGSDPSMLGLGYMRSDNGSRAYRGSTTLAFAENRWTINATLAEADLNYDLILGSAAVPLSQTGLFGRFGLVYGFASGISLGIEARYIETEVSLDIAGFIPPSLLPSASVGIASVGMTAEYDSRDDTIYPTAGHHLFLRATQNRITTGLGPDYGKATLTWDLFQSLGDRNVLAVRMATCAAGSGAPFFDQCSIGGSDSMRGFNSTRFLDERLLSSQLELRTRLTGRLGIATFIGAGAVGDSYSSLNTSGSAGGVGLRYRVSRKFPVDLTMDVTLNDLGDRQLYISVGQRF